MNIPFHRNRTLAGLIALVNALPAGAEEVALPPLQTAQRGAAVSVLASGSGAANAVDLHYQQARLALLRLRDGLTRHGLGLEDVARTRIHVDDIAGFDGVARAHREVFAEAPPTTTLVQSAPPAAGLRVWLQAEALSGSQPVRRLTSDSPLASRFGFSLLWERDDHGFVTGLTGLGADGRIPVGHGAAAQLATAIDKLRRLLERAGFGLQDVVRTRLYVRDIGELDAYAKVHAAAFGAAPPATTVVQVERLFSPDMQVELDVDLARGAVRRQPGGSRWEPWFGFSRGASAGRRCLVSGSSGQGQAASTQAIDAVRTLDAALRRAGCGWRDVQHLNLLYRQPEDLAALRLALDQVLPAVERPVLMPLPVARLAGERMRLELDAEAWQAQPASQP